MGGSLENHAKLHAIWCSNIPECKNSSLTAPGLKFFESFDQKMNCTTKEEEEPHSNPSSVLVSSSGISHCTEKPSPNPKGRPPSTSSNASASPSNMDPCMKSLAPNPKEHAPSNSAAPASPSNMDPCMKSHATDSKEQTPSDSGKAPATASPS